MKRAALQSSVIILITLLVVLGYKVFLQVSEEEVIKPGVASHDAILSKAEETERYPRTASEWLRGRLLNIPLRTHENKPVRFYDDLVKDKIVLINFIFTACDDLCPPMIANLVMVQKLLGDRVGRDIFMLSISLDPVNDTPEVLKAYAEHYGTKPGWTFLTGKYEDIEKLRRKLGIYDPDPIIDADKEQHAGLVTFGNERTGRWAALPALMSPKQIVKAVLRITDPTRGRGHTATHPRIDVAVR